MSSDAIAIQTAEDAGRPWVETLHDWVTTVDHKRLGILYVVYALVFLVIGGIEATIIRIQLMYPHNNFVSPQVFNRMFTMHGTTMIFFVVMPMLFGFANYLTPLMIGARDIPAFFPHSTTSSVSTNAGWPPLAKVSQVCTTTFLPRAVGLGPVSKLRRAWLECRWS